MQTLKKIPLMLVVAALSQIAVAQDAGQQKALAKAQYMLRQVTAEKTELQTQVQTLQQQVDKLSKELESTKTSASNDKQKLEQKYGDAIGQWKAQGDKLNEQLTVTREQLKKETGQRTQLEENLKTESENFTLCYENNKKLYTINRELLERYQRKGFGDVIGQKEPFTGLKQVEVENLIQDYQYRIGELKLKSGSSDSSNEPGGRVATP